VTVTVPLIPEHPLTPEPVNGAGTRA